MSFDDHGHVFSELGSRIAEAFTADNAVEKTGCEIALARPGNALSVRVFQMYEPVAVTPQSLARLAEIVESDRIDVGDVERTMAGCDSCDYGSELSITFTVYGSRFATMLGSEA